MELCFHSPRHAFTTCRQTNLPCLTELQQNKMFVCSALLLVILLSCTILVYLRILQFVNLVVSSGNCDRYSVSTLGQILLSLIACEILSVCEQFRRYYLVILFDSARREIFITFILQVSSNSVEYELCVPLCVCVRVRACLLSRKVRYCMQHNFTRTNERKDLASLVFNPQTPN